MPSTRYKFVEPSDLEDAENRIAILVDETQDIESQLSNPDKKEPSTGERMTVENYRGWKYQASRALAIKRAEQRFIRRWIKQHWVINRTKALENLEGDPPLNLLNGLYVMVKRWVRKGVSLTHIEPSEQELLDVIRHYLDDPTILG